MGVKRRFAKKNAPYKERRSQRRTFRKHQFVGLTHLCKWSTHSNVGYYITDPPLVSNEIFAPKVGAWKSERLLPEGLFYGRNKDFL